MRIVSNEDEDLCCNCVWQIERIQNKTLWQSYQLMKTQMEVKNKHKNNERQLFHGTDGDSVKFINQRGFDRGFAGTHGNIPDAPSPSLVSLLFTTC